MILLCDYCFIYLSKILLLFVCILYVCISVCVWCVARVCVPLCVCVCACVCTPFVYFVCRILLVYMVYVCTIGPLWAARRQSSVHRAPSLGALLRSAKAATVIWGLIPSVSACPGSDAELANSEGDFKELLSLLSIDLEVACFAVLNIIIVIASSPVCVFNRSVRASRFPSCQMKCVSEPFCDLHSFKGAARTK